MLKKVFDMISLGHVQTFLGVEKIKRDREMNILKIYQKLKKNFLIYCCKKSNILFINVLVSHNIVFISKPKKTFNIIMHIKTRYLHCCRVTW